MTQEEYSAQHKKLSNTKKGYDTNRTLCTGVFLITLYFIFKDKDYLSMPWYILLVLGLVVLGSVGILIYDSFLIKKVNKQLKELESNKSL